MGDVFISYKSSRRNAVSFLAEILEARGYSSWFDYWLVAGGDFGQQIEARLRAAKVCLTLWCSQSRESRWVLEEATLAGRLGIFVPILLEPIEIPLGFSRAQAIDLRTWDGDPESSLLDRLFEELATRCTGSGGSLEKRAALSLRWLENGSPAVLGWPLRAPLSDVEGARGAFAERADCQPRRGSVLVPTGTHSVKTQNPTMRGLLGPSLTPWQSETKRNYFSEIWTAPSHPFVLTQTMASAPERQVRIWDVNTGGVVRTFPFNGRGIHNREPEPMFVNADASLLLTRAGDALNKYSIVSTNDGEIKATLESSNSFSPRLVARWKGEDDLSITEADNKVLVRLEFRAGQLGHCSRSAWGDLQIKSIDAMSRRVLVILGDWKVRRALLLDERLNSVAEHDITDISPGMGSYGAFSQWGDHYWLHTSAQSIGVFSSADGKAVRSFGAASADQPLREFAILGSDAACASTPGGTLTCWNLDDGRVRFTKSYRPWYDKELHVRPMRNGQVLALGVSGSLTFIDAKSGLGLGECASASGRMRVFNNGECILHETNAPEITIFQL
jgi:hypothetical protein